MFKKKLNASETPIDIEERINIENGVYEGSLTHDNVVRESITILDSDGIPVRDVTISNNPTKEWETVVRIRTGSKYVIAHYKTFGDVVDADDINMVCGVAEKNAKQIKENKDKIEEKSPIGHTHDSDSIVGLDNTIQDLEDKISNAGKVKSVNEKTGYVVLDADNINLPGQDFSISDALNKIEETLKEIESTKAKKEHSHVAHEVKDTNQNKLQSDINKNTLDAIELINKAIEEIINDNNITFFHDLPQNTVKEDMTPSEFRYGTTLCSQSVVSDFPTINEYGVSVTFRGQHSNYAQIFITRFGDIWSRRSGVINEWNGEWYNSKKEIDQKADKDKVVTSINGKVGDVVLETGGGETSRSSTIVIANYDSHENSKKGADFVIKEGENASETINSAIKSLEGIGGEIKLMEGNYNVCSEIRARTPNVHLVGVLGATVLKQNKDWTGGAVSYVIEAAGLDDGMASISNLTVEGARISLIGGISCSSSSRVTNCTVNNVGGDGFFCIKASQATNCTSTNNNNNGFACMDTAQITNCTSINNNSYGFLCTHSSQITNCTSVDNDDDGIYLSDKFQGICAFNTLKGNTLQDKSSAPAVVEYNIIQEVAK